MESNFSRKMQRFYDAGGFNIALDGEVVAFKYIGCLKISHIWKDFYNEYKVNLESKLDELGIKFNLSEFQVRWLPDAPRALDTVAFVCYRYNVDHLKIIKELDGVFMGDSDEHGFEGKYLAVKPNRFTNSRQNYIFPRTNFQAQESAVMQFNNRHYYPEVVNKRNANPCAIAKLMNIQNASEAGKDEDWDEPASNNKKDNVGLLDKINIKSEPNNYETDEKLRDACAKMTRDLSIDSRNQVNNKSKKMKLESPINKEAKRLEFFVNEDIEDGVKQSCENLCTKWYFKDGESSWTTF